MLIILASPQEECFIFKEEDDNTQGFLAFGGSYNFLDKKHYIPGTIDKKAFKEPSIDVGGGGRIGRFMMGFLFNSHSELKAFWAFSF